MEAIVVGHGRRHSPIPYIDYERSLFIDIDENCLPDLVFDMRRDTYAFDIYQQYPNVIFINSENTIFGRSKTLHQQVILNLHYMLLAGGTLEMKPLYFDNTMTKVEAENLFVRQMSQAGFRLKGIVRGNFFTFTRGV